MNNRINIPPAPIEKIVAALSYMTMGFVGFVWLILGLFTKSSLKPFLQYHIFQSIFLSIGFFLLCQLLGLLMNVLSFIPFVNQLVLAGTFYLNMPLIYGASIIQFCCYSVILYLMLTSLSGKYSYIPWVSEIIKTNIKA